MPYEQVFQIIENIKEQAAPQISGASTQPPPFETISTEELN
jgi:hypothetical protein